MRKELFKIAHWVKCKVCGESFNRDKEEAVLISPRRYAHKKCVETYEEDLKDLEHLQEYIKQLFKVEKLPAKVDKQIKSFKKEYEYSYSGMEKSLIWFYEIKRNSLEKANGGIGIIPYIYQEATQYYYALYLAKLANEKVDMTIFSKEIREIKIPSPKTYSKPPKLFNIEIGDDTDEE